MQRAIIGLRVLWVVLMIWLLFLLLTESITGLGVVFYSIVVLAVLLAERVMVRRAHT